MKKILTFVLIIAAMLTLGSCSESSNHEGGFYPEYLPFRNEGGKWGLLGIDGKVLFADKFDVQPTEAYNGRFFVKNDKGLYEIYKAESDPERVGDKAYKMIFPFYEDVTVAVETGNPVTLIDKDGDIVATLDKIDNKKVLSVDAFYDGLAVFHLEGGTCGCINTKGEVVVKPEWDNMYYFNEGKFIAIKSNEQTEDSEQATDEEDYDEGENMGEEIYDEAADGGDESPMQYVLDSSGNVLFKKSLSEYNIISPFSDGKAIVMVGNQKHNYGVIDEKGELILSDIKQIIVQTKGEQYIAMDYGASHAWLGSISGGEQTKLNDRFHFTSQDGILSSKTCLAQMNGTNIEYLHGSDGYSDLNNGYFLAKSSKKYKIVDIIEGNNMADGKTFDEVVINEKSLNDRHKPSDEPTAYNDVFDATLMLKPLSITNEGSIGGFYIGMAPYEYIFALEQIDGKGIDNGLEHRFIVNGYTYSWRLKTGLSPRGDSGDFKVARQVSVYIKSTILNGIQKDAKSALIEALKKAGWKYERTIKEVDILTFAGNTMMIYTDSSTTHDYHKDWRFDFINRGLDTVEGLIRIEMGYSEDMQYDISRL